MLGVVQDELLWVDILQEPREWFALEVLGIEENYTFGDSKELIVCHLTCLNLSRFDTEPMSELRRSGRCM